MGERENENSGLDVEKVAPHTADITKPPRKKRRIIRKILLVLLVVIILLAGYWIFEDIRWTRRLDAQLAEYRAAGQPVDIEDFAPPPTPDDNNAALAYKKAFELLELDDEQYDLIMHDFSPDKIATSPYLMKAAIEANPKTLKLIRDARSMTGCDWGINYHSKSIDDLLSVSSLGDCRVLGKFLRSTAVYYHNTGNDAAAVETIRDMLPLANAQRSQFIIGSLVAISIDAVACNTIETIAKDLTVATPETQQKHSASRKAVKELINELLDEKDVRNRMHRSFLSERAFSVKCHQLWLNGEWSIKGNLLLEGRETIIPERFDIV